MSLAEQAHAVGDCYSGRPPPKAEALHGAKRRLKSPTPKQNREMLTPLGFDVDQLAAQYRAERGGRNPSQDPPMVVLRCALHPRRRLTGPRGQRCQHGRAEHPER